MVRKIINAAVLASMAVVGFAAVPAAAQDYYGRGGYSQSYDGDRYGDHDRREVWLARQRYWQHERWEQHQRWEQERARREYWQREGYEHRRWDGNDY